MLPVGSIRRLPHRRSDGGDGIIVGSGRRATDIHQVAKDVYAQMLNTGKVVDSACWTHSSLNHLHEVESLLKVKTERDKRKTQPKTSFSVRWELGGFGHVPPVTGSLVSVRLSLSLSLSALSHVVYCRSSFRFGTRRGTPRH